MNDYLSVGKERVKGINFVIGAHTCWKETVKVINVQIVELDL